MNKVTYNASFTVTIIVGCPISQRCTYENLNQARRFPVLALKALSSETIFVSYFRSMSDLHRRLRDVSIL